MKILALIDYKGNFGSKNKAKPYRSGMDLELLKDQFETLGFEIEYKMFSDISFKTSLSTFDIVLYTSSEDNGYKYKDYIEDIIYGIEQKGNKVIPEYKFLRANNNKVFMEILGKIMIKENNLNSYYVCVPKEQLINNLSFPIVFKEAAEAMSSGVALIKNKKQLKNKIKQINKIDNLLNFKNIIKETLRAYKYPNYIKESLYRNKFILQEFIPNLESDYKILIYGNRYYIFERPVRKNDFRASGSGHSIYKYGSKANVNLKIFDFAENIFNQFNVPFLSLDICYDGKKFYFFEFQAIYFGTVGQNMSDGYYLKKDSNWIFIQEKLDLEKVYADSIGIFCKKNNIQ